MSGSLFCWFHACLKTQMRVHVQYVQAGDAKHSPASGFYMIVRKKRKRRMQINNKRKLHRTICV